MGFYVKYPILQEIVGSLRQSIFEENLLDLFHLMLSWVDEVVEFILDRRKEGSFWIWKKVGDHEIGTWIWRWGENSREFMRECKSDNQMSSVQFSPPVVSNSCDPMDCSMPGFSVHHQLQEFIQTHVHWVSDAIQPCLSPSPPTFNLSQHQGLFKWVSFLYQLGKVLEFQLQHQSFQWIFRTDFL